MTIEGEGRRGDPGLPAAKGGPIEQTIVGGKDPSALRTIGEVAAALGIRPHVLRYWEEQFPMLRPIKRGGMRRYYRPEDVALVSTIDRLVHREGYTLRGAHAAIATQRRAAVAPASASATPAADRLSPNDLHRLLAIRAELATALRAS